MKNSDRLFIGACCGVPFGLVGMSVTVLLTMIYNKVLKMYQQK